MKFFCYRKDLSDTLNFVTRAVAVKPLTPILSGVYIKAEGALLELHANNQTTGIVAKIPAKIDEPGNIVVSGKRFQEFVRGLSDEMINCYIDGNEFVIDGSNSKVSLLTMAPSDFPTVKQFDTTPTFMIRADRLCNLFRRSVFAAAKNDSRPVFTGINFAIKDNCLSFNATDTHRIAIAHENFITATPDCNFILPAESASAILARLPNSDSDTVDISVTEKYIGFAFENVFLTSRRIEGQFPPTDRVIPQSTATNIFVDTKEFLDALNFIKLMSKETEFNTVRLGIGSDSIDISASSREIGDAVKKITAQIDGPDLDISFNIDYLIDVLKVIAEPKIKVGFNDKFSPATFTELGNDNYIYVATPVRTA